MCGRFAFDSDLKELKSRFRMQTELDVIQRHYNIAPGMAVPIITNDSVVLARWGLVPSWAKDPNIGYKMINARAEGIADKPAFRKPFRSQRCLVPASGFFEWKRLTDKDKVPYYIRLKDEKLFAFAGLYDEWKDAEGHPVLTFAIITTEPNSLIEPIHNRMPVVFDKNEEDAWLSPDMDDIAALGAMLAPYPAENMEAYPVSQLVNSPKNDIPEILKPRSEQGLLI